MSNVKPPQMTSEELNRLASSGSEAFRQFEAALDKIFDEFERGDPVLARECRRMGGSRRATARFLIHPCREFHGLSPLQALARGQRNQILSLLGQLADPNW